MTSTDTMTDLERARQKLDADQLAFVLVRNGEIIATGAESGVIELLATLDRLGGATRGASLADKVVGKAVALLVIHFGIVGVDAGLASQAAVDFCARNNLPLRARLVVPQILNRRNDGPCPMERLTTKLTDAGGGVAALRAFFATREVQR